MQEPDQRKRGRPSEGRRVTVRLTPRVIDFLDECAAVDGVSRARAVRRILEDAMRPSRDGVDRAQIQRMLALPPAARIRHMAAVANAMAPIRRVASRRR